MPNSKLPLGSIDHRIVLDGRNTLRCRHHHVAVLSGQDPTVVITSRRFWLPRLVVVIVIRS